MLGHRPRSVRLEPLFVLVRRGPCARALLLPAGDAGMAFAGAVLMMRAALLELGEALKAIDQPSPTDPGGTFSA